MDSGLLLLALVGLCCAYLVPHALRRREQLSAARATDRFSDAMRVLVRRPLPGSRGADAVLVRHAGQRPGLLSSPELTLVPTAGPPLGSTAPFPGSSTRRPGVGRGVCLPATGALTFSGLAALACVGVALLGVVGALERSPLLVWVPAGGLAQLAVVVVLLRARARRRGLRRRSAPLPAPSPAPSPGRVPAQRRAATARPGNGAVGATGRRQGPRADHGEEGSIREPRPA